VSAAQALGIDTTTPVQPEQTVWLAQPLSWAAPRHGSGHTPSWPTARHDDTIASSPPVTRVTPPEPTLLPDGSHVGTTHVHWEHGRLSAGLDILPLSILRPCDTGVVTEGAPRKRTPRPVIGTRAAATTGAAISVGPASERLAANASPLPAPASLVGFGMVLAGTTLAETPSYCARRKPGRSDPAPQHH